jgi:sulfoxide reductase heme-binding subunit YedZ
MIAAAVHGPSPLWYATRGAGAMTLALLSAATIMGIAESRRWRPAGAARFEVAALHRTISLLAVAMLAVHVATTVLDPFPPIGLATAVVPFAASYRTLWLGLGTLACDLLLALAATSLLRRRLGHRAWAATHWAAYACWPVAVLHGFGTGSDASATWMLALSLGSVASVLAALLARVARSRPRARTAVLAATGAGAAGLAVWLPQGPLGAHWARRAGTPASVLAAFSPRPVARQAAVPRPDRLGRRFEAAVSGPVAQGLSADGLAVVDMDMHVAGGPAGDLRIRLGGQALPDGGLSMDRSAVTLGPPGDPQRYRGRIDFLRGTMLRALLGSRQGRAIRLTVSLRLGEGGATGRVLSVPVSGGAA